MIDLTNDRSIRLFHRVQLLIMQRLEGAMLRKLSPIINRQYMETARLIKQGVNDVPHTVNAQAHRLRNLYQQHYRRVATVAGNRAINKIVSEKSAQMFFTKDTLGQNFWREMNSFIDVQTRQRLASVQKTTTLNLTKVIAKGVDEGLSNNEIAKKLRRLGKRVSKTQALRIARTETHAAFNKSNDAAIEGTGRKFIRQWATTLDERTRRKPPDKFDHAKANKQKRAQRAPFDVGGQKLMFPGDPSASAGNVINCRCVLLYLTDKSQVVREPELKPVEEVFPEKILDIRKESVREDFEGLQDITKDDLRIYNKHFGIPPRDFAKAYGDVPGYKSELNTFEYKLLKDKQGKLSTAKFNFDMELTNKKNFDQSATIKRIFEYDFNKKELSVNNFLFTITEESQGKGIGKIVWRNAHALHKELNVDHVRLYATLDNGGYAWPKYGFTPSY